MQNSEQMGGLGEKFEGFGAAPSDALWGNIAGALDEKGSKKGFIWWWIGSGLAAILLVSAVIYNSSQIDNMAPIVETNANEFQKSNLDHRATISAANNDLRIVSFNSLQMNAQSDLALNKTDRSMTEKMQKPKLNSDKQNKIEEPLNHNLAQKNKIDSAEFALLTPFYPRSKVSLMDKMPLTTLFGINQKLILPELIINEEKKSGRPWEIGFRVGYYADLSPDVDAEGLTNNFTVTSDLGSGPDSYIPGSEIGLAEAYNNVDPTSFAGDAHKRINVDFTIAKYVAARFTLSSGLNFTRSAYNTTYNFYQKSFASTNITSLALPLGIGFDAVKRNRFKLRTSATLNNEFSVYENEKSTYLSSPSTSSNGFTKGYSASVDFSIQNHIRLQKGFYLTVSPTYRRYLLQNIRSENLLVEKNNWIGGTVGLIWHL